MPSSGLGGAGSIVYISKCLNIMGCNRKGLHRQQGLRVRVHDPPVGYIWTYIIRSRRRSPSLSLLTSLVVYIAIIRNLLFLFFARKVSPYITWYGTRGKLAENKHLIDFQGNLSFAHVRPSTLNPWTSVRTSN